MINKILDYFEEGLCCVCLVVMTALTFINVLSRYVFNASLSFSEEITTYLFVLLSLLARPSLQSAARTSASLC